VIASYFIQFSYIVAAALFILSLKWLSHPTTARRGVRAGEVGMALAIVGTLVHHEIVSYQWILVGFILGTAIGLPLAVFMPMTHVPQRTALSHAFGALAAALVGTAEYYLNPGTLSTFTMTALSLEVILGFLTFTGSLMAFGKLQDLVPSRPIVYRGAERRQPVALGRCRRRGRLPRGGPRAERALSGDGGPVATVRGPADHPHRWRRHADGDLAAQLLRGAVCGRHGLRARQ
jgi:NAD(P) transhydrogenase subunit beta